MLVQKCAPKTKLFWSWFFHCGGGFGHGLGMVWAWFGHGFGMVWAWFWHGSQWFGHLCRFVCKSSHVLSCNSARASYLYQQVYIVSHVGFWIPLAGRIPIYAGPCLWFRMFIPFTSAAFLFPLIECSFWPLEMGLFLVHSALTWLGTFRMQNQHAKSQKNINFNWYMFAFVP